MRASKTFSQLKRENGLVDTKDYRPSPSKRGYGRRWRVSRIVFLRKNPLCVTCLKDGRIEPATVVDHIEPHKGDMAVFWDWKNWQALCKPCHDRKTAKEDGGFGRSRGQ